MPPALAEPPHTLPQALERAARLFPEQGIALFEGRGRRFERRTYPEVLASLRHFAGRWAEAGISPGDRVLVALPTSWAWLEAWMGALLAGALPVAVAPGAAFGTAEAQIRKVENLMERLDARRAVTSAGFRDDAARAGARLTAERALTPEELAAFRPVTVSAPEPAPGEVAFLQLTSGSTAFPRAVAIPHRAAIHNALGCDEGIGAPHGDWATAGADALVSWLPLHHDMGLVGTLLLAVVGGIDLWLMQPTTFLARPRVWLEQLGAHGTVFAHAPNFAYQLCLERLSTEQRVGLDLGSWRDAMNGAEMIRPETVAAFEEAFGPHGFRPETFRPCYGLAEGTLAVTIDRRGEGVRTRPIPEGGGAGGASSGWGLGEVACLGAPILETEVKIAGPGGRALPEETVGEVWAKGPSVFAGYLNDPEATAETLEDGWLKTGDLGFLARGELYLTGRLKDLLIVHGHNFAPHEIEWQAEAVTGGGGALRTGAFAVAHGAEGEQAVLAVEVADRDPEALGALEREIRLRIAHELSLPLAEVIFVRRGKIPKTTSGKVQRRQLRDLYLRGEMEAIR